MKKKLLSVSLAVIIAVMAISGASLAWLQDTTQTVTNTFTEGLVDIDLWEYDYVQSTNTLDTSTKVTSESDYKMIPGNVLPKNPTVTVKANSEACYVFVKIVESTNFKTFMEYKVDSKWTALGDAYPGVYYMELDALTAADTDYTVLEAVDAYTTGAVTVKNTVTMKDMTDNTVDPTLSFTAYAIQQLGFADAAAAWAEIGA